jgi:hypothetical protein
MADAYEGFGHTGVQLVDRHVADFVRHHPRQVSTFAALPRRAAQDDHIAGDGEPEP